MHNLKYIQIARFLRMANIDRKVIYADRLLGRLDGLSICRGENGKFLRDNNEAHFEGILRIFNEMSESLSLYSISGPEPTVIQRCFDDFTQEYQMYLGNEGTGRERVENLLKAAFLFWKFCRNKIPLKDYDHVRKFDFIDPSLLEEIIRYSENWITFFELCLRQVFNLSDKRINEFEGIKSQKEDETE